MDNYTKKEANKYGTVFYYNDKGKFHRLDGPAIEREDGSKEWWVNNSLHRENGPAIEYSSGQKIWYFKGKRHRLNGPAISLIEHNEWWIYGSNYSKSEHNRFVLFSILEPRRFHLIPGIKYGKL